MRFCLIFGHFMVVLRVQFEIFQNQWNFSKEFWYFSSDFWWFYDLCPQRFFKMRLLKVLTFNFWQSFNFLHIFDYFFASSERLFECLELFKWILIASKQFFDNLWAMMMFLARFCSVWFLGHFFEAFLTNSERLFEFLELFKGSLIPSKQHLMIFGRWWCFWQVSVWFLGHFQPILNDCSSFINPEKHLNIFQTQWNWNAEWYLWKWLWILINFLWQSNGSGVIKSFGTAKRHR